MAVIIGSARIDEHGNVTGGKAGDQTGCEVATENFYMHKLGWYCLRPKDPKQAELIAKEMKAACDNQNIGYDQSQRLDIISAITKAKTMSKISWKIECDCSSLVRACVMAAGMGDPGNFTTYNEAKVLEATGKFEPRFKLASGSQLCNGDVIVTCSKGHTCICVQGKPRVVEPPASTGKLSKTPKWVGRVNCYRLNVYKEPSAKAERLSSYPQLGRNNLIDVCDTVYENWSASGKRYYYIRIDGVYGYKYGFVEVEGITSV